ncbi:M23 family metallopeptidase [Shewanella marina]|uniref:M23 family metallopeptidase n=1 Tax=Shewanella marina TaxID=487319 RepID=UPI00046E5F65|nr:M23 family metallopeptidase [Shewanella marina]
MSVTVFIQGRKGTTRWQPGKRWLLLPLLLIAAGTGLYQQNETRLVEHQAELDQERDERALHKNEIEQLRVATKEQLAQLVTHVASLQAKMSRLEALGQHVAVQNKLENQFNFSSEVGVGGVNHSGSDIELAQLLQEMEQLSARIDNNNVQLSLLETVASNLHIDEERYLSGRPINSGWLSSPYGLRNDPFNGRRTMHKGIDFAGSEGADVITTGGGVVTWAGSKFGYGNLVEIDHGNGLSTRYGHNKSVSVAVGDVVAKGEKIASMGSTGRSTGPHVHYEVLRGGQQIDPGQFVYRKAGY